MSTTAAPSSYNYYYYYGEWYYNYEYYFIRNPTATRIPTISISPTAPSLIPTLAPSRPTRRPVSALPTVTFLPTYTPTDPRSRRPSTAIPSRKGTVAPSRTFRPTISARPSKPTLRPASADSNYFYYYYYYEYYYYYSNVTDATTRSPSVGSRTIAPTRSLNTKNPAGTVQTKNPNWVSVRPSLSLAPTDAYYYYYYYYYYYSDKMTTRKPSSATPSISYSRSPTRRTRTPTLKPTLRPSKHDGTSVYYYYALETAKPSSQFSPSPSGAIDSKSSSISGVGFVGSNGFYAVVIIFCLVIPILLIAAAFFYLRKKSQKANPLGSKEYAMVSMVGVSTLEDEDEVIDLKK